MYYMAINKYVMINSNHDFYVEIISNYYTEYIQNNPSSVTKRQKRRH